MALSQAQKDLLVVWIGEKTVASNNNWTWLADYLDSDTSQSAVNAELKTWLEARQAANTALLEVLSNQNDVDRIEAEQDVIAGLITKYS